jgi:uncharacterized protein (DUF1697 family)
MSDRRVALLRGINLARAKRIAMADLCQLFEDLGHADVRTLLNSGNVVFTAGGRSGDRLEERLERAIAERLGVTTSVIVLTGREVAAAVRGNPLGKVATNPAKLLVVALRDAKAAASLTPLLEQRWRPEAIALEKRIAYLWCADGIHSSRLWTAVNRAAGDGATARNIATMTKLLEMIESS